MVNGHLLSVVVDLKGNYLFVNDAFCRFLQRDRSELLGRDPVVFTHPDDQELSAIVSERFLSSPSLLPHKLEQVYLYLQSLNLLFTRFRLH